MRCVVMLIYGFKLVVIPFYEEHSNVHQSLNGHSEKSNEIEMNTSGVTNELIHNVSSKTHHTTTSTSLSSYTIDLRKLDNWLEVRIIDIEFLYGYYEPTLFILCESNLTWLDVLSKILMYPCPIRLFHWPFEAPLLNLLCLEIKKCEKNQSSH